MFSVIYSFRVKKDAHQDFEQVWKEMTLLIKQFEGGLGSRLHKKSPNEYIAYAQWPSKEMWQNAGNNLPVEATLIREKMRSYCHTIETLYELDVVDDLLTHSLTV